MTVSPPNEASLVATRPWRFGRRALVQGHLDLGGTGALNGTVRVSGVLAARTVLVYDEATLTLAGETVSHGSTGAWTLTGLTTTRPLRVIVRGHTGERDVTIRGIYAV